MPVFLAGLAAVAGVWVLVEVFVFIGEGLGRSWWWFWHVAYFWLASFPEIFLVQIALDQVQGRKPSLASSVRNFKRVNGWFLAKCLSILVIAAGLLILLLPGVFLAVSWQFAPFRYLDVPVSLGDAFRDSSRLTRGIRFRLFRYDLLLLLINLLALAFLGFGLLLSIPLSLLAVAYLYRDRLAASGD